MISEKAGVSLSTTPAESMKANGKIINVQEMDMKSTKMAIYLKVLLVITSHTVKVYTSGKMAKCLMVSG